jgi:serine/threonine protein kinase
VLLDEGEARVADFGIIPLAWLPTGESAASINGKYAAPELMDRRPSPSADQYGLALMYAEMLTGAHPRPARPGSGVLRKPGPRGSAPTRAVRLDLDLLPAHDREPVARALSHEPGRRFGSCVAFVEALEQAGAAVTPKADLYASLPAVIPYCSLMGEPPTGDVVLPEVGQLVVALIQPPPVPAVEGPQGARYRILADGSWEYRCPLQLFPGAMDLKVAGLIGYWHARVLHHAGDSYKLDFEVPGQKATFWDAFRTQPRVEVSINVDPSSSAGTRLTEAVVQVRYRGQTREQTDRVLNHISPKVFDTIRTYFQASQEQRGRERFPLALPARVYPVLPDLELAETIEATTRNISFGGMSLLTRGRPCVEHLYLHLHSSPAALGYATLARMVRCQEAEGGWEIGVRFVERRV